MGLWWDVESPRSSSRRRCSRGAQDRFGSRVMGDYLGLQVMLGARDAVANMARLLRYMYYIICSLDVRCINPPTRATLPSSSFYPALPIITRCSLALARLPPPVTSLGRVQTSAGRVTSCPTLPLRQLFSPSHVPLSRASLTSPLPARLRPRGCLLTQLPSPPAAPRVCLRTPPP
jgi:hypothetical protein